MTFRLIGSIAALAALVGPVVALDGPEEPVKAIYGPAGMPDTAKEADRWLARDVARAYKKDLAADEPRPSTDFDWRFGQQDYDASEINVGLGDGFVGGSNLMDVRVSFKSFNQGPYTVTWTMCLGRKGWRVANVSSTDAGGGFDLREMLELPADRVQC